MAPTSSPRLGYLGPEGTFTEAALRTLPAAAQAEHRPYATVPLTLDAVRSSEITGGVVPIENSVEGGVNITLDSLASGDPLMIRGEIVVPVEFALLARPGMTLADCKRVSTHPHAAAQCRRWVAENLPFVDVSYASSTAAAAAEVADHDGAEHTVVDAALAAPLAAEHYGLEIIADGVGDNHQAVTRFVYVELPGAPPPHTGADKTSLIAYIRDDHPGALLAILEEFAVRGVNLSRIESRPTGDGIGRYCFSIDGEGHIDESRVGEALMGLRRVCADVRFLGSYARADGVRTAIRPGTTGSDFTDAAEWLAGLRQGQVSS